MPPGSLAAADNCTGGINPSPTVVGDAYMRPAEVSHCRKRPGRPIGRPYRASRKIVIIFKIPAAPRAFSGRRAITG